MTDTINVANIIDVLTYKTKNNVFTQKEALYYSKAIAQLKMGTITNVNSYVDILVGNIGRLYYVAQEGKLYYATPAAGDNVTTASRIILLADTTQKQMWSWGDNRCLQLGGSFTNSIPLQQPPYDKDVSTVTAGELFGSFIRDNGTLWSWGNNLCGQSGIGTFGATNTSVPTQEKTLSCVWTAASSGCLHTIALKNDNTLWSWGGSPNGELGNNFQALYSSPVQVVGGLRWCVASAGYTFNLAVACTGELYGWGNNVCGQLGNNSTILRASPVKEASLSTNWCAVATGALTGYGIKTDGSLWAWGNGACGVLGDNTIVNKSSPIREITSSANWRSVSSRTAFASAIKSDGSLWSWGDNQCGQLGTNSIISASSPVREITSSTNWCQISTGNCFMAAIKKDGSLWTWGNNFCGQLGIGVGDINARSSPTREATSATNWTQVAAGCAFVLAKKIKTF